MFGPRNVARPPGELTRQRTTVLVEAVGLAVFILTVFVLTGANFGFVSHLSPGVYHPHYAVELMVRVALAHNRVAQRRKGVRGHVEATFDYFAPRCQLNGPAQPALTGNPTLGVTLLKRSLVTRRATVPGNVVGLGLGLGECGHYGGRRLH